MGGFFGLFRSRAVRRSGHIDCHLTLQALRVLQLRSLIGQRMEAVLSAAEDSHTEAEAALDKLDVHEVRVSLFGPDARRAISVPITTENLSFLMTPVHRVAGIVKACSGIRGGAGPGEGRAGPTRGRSQT